ncbi:MAG TPA: 50S ribosomal protein L20 [Alphaproteobacteria bacterium]|nr:50S ribosomal protein L20 [Alphaproteobacteria bacterium]
MARVKGGVNSRARHKKIKKMAKGYYGRSKNCYVVAVEKVEKGLQYAYRDRKAKKRTFRRLWITRINAAVRQNELKYSTFANGLKLANISLDRKVLAQIAYESPEQFKSICDQVKQALEANKKAA